MNGRRPHVDVQEHATAASCAHEVDDETLYKHGLARTAWPHDCDKLPVLYFKTDVMERRRNDIVVNVIFREFLNNDHWFI